ncbi:MAG: aldo/keto reductase [Hyphomicrobiales bacterium]|jgi:hypothetical protein|nr:aldo/keto reductase [Hyphomicrobiales bacterium]
MSSDAALAPENEVIRSQKATVNHARAWKTNDQPSKDLPFGTSLRSFGRFWRLWRLALGYLLWARDPKVDVWQELGIGFVPWCPLGQGFLMGKVSREPGFDTSDVRSWFPRFTPEGMGRAGVCRSWRLGRFNLGARFYWLSAPVSEGQSA